MTPTLSEIADVAHDTFVKMKKKEVKENGPGSDLRGMVEFWRGGRRQLMWMPEGGRDELFVTFRCGHFWTAADVIVLMTEGYSIQQHKIEGETVEEARARMDALSLPPGSLAKRFAEGDPNVGEQLTVLVAGTDGSAHRLTEFWYDGPKVVFGETIVKDEIAGAMVEVMREALTEKTCLDIAAADGLLPSNPDEEAVFWATAKASGIMDLGRSAGGIGALAADSKEEVEALDDAMRRVQDEVVRIEDE